MKKKELHAWFNERGFTTSYSGKCKTLYLYNYTPDIHVDIPEDTGGITIVGLHSYKLN